jgi:flagellar protein FliO/FliZ
MLGKKIGLFFISLCILFNPLCLEAKVNLSNMNLLKNVETNSTEDELTIRFNFKNRLGKYNQPVFFKKSIEIDFPFVYAKPAKQFIKTGDQQISQIYVSQFNEKKTRVRLIFGDGQEGDYENRFHLQKEGNSLEIRVDRKEIDVLGEFLARTTEKIKDNEQKVSIDSINTPLKTKNNIKLRTEIPEKPQPFSNSSENLKENASGKIKKVSFTENKKWKTNKKLLETPSNSVKKASFGFLKSSSESDSNPASLESSGFKMAMTLSIVLGLIFLLFFGFKKYVLKNTMFGGGGKLVQVLSTNFLAPKKNITLVEVAGEVLVLGISDQNISLLTSIRESDRIEDIKNLNGETSNDNDLRQGLSKNIPGKVSLASSNAANVFSKYLKQFSSSESSKEASVASVTEKIRNHTRKVRTA